MIKGQDLHPRNSNYFEVIDSQDKAYWLGIMYSDGCVSQRKNGGYRVGLGMTDLEHVEKLKNILGAHNNKITVTYPQGFENALPFYQVNFYDDKMAEDLIKHGCVPRKSTQLTCLPNIPNEFMYDFLRGFFDGDGSLWYSNTTNKYHMSFTGGSPMFLSDVKKFLNLCRINISKNDKGVYRFNISSSNDVHNTLINLYEHSTEETRLNRKYDKYQEYLEWLKQVNKLKEVS